MSWQLTIRLFGNKPDGRRDPVTHKHVLESLGDVGLLVELAKREGEVIYAFIEPKPGWLDIFDRPVPPRPRKPAPLRVVG